MVLRLVSAEGVVANGEVLRDAGVVADGGRILGVGTVEELRRRFGELEREHFSGVMMPGFVNAHVHLELGYQRRVGDGPVVFTEWVSGLLRNYPAPEKLERVAAEAVRDGVAESLAAGVTCVGDISRQCAVSRRELNETGIRAVSFGEVVGLGKMRGRLDMFLNAAADRRFESERVTLGLSPHAPYTVEGPALKKIVDRAAAEGFPVAMHLAELSEEREFLRNLSGPLGWDWDLMQKMDVLDTAIPSFEGGPVWWAKEWGLLGPLGVRVLLAHVNYADREDIALLAASRASVVYCPRTRVFFGHEARAKHPYRAMLAAGVNVCLGTDSLASNPDLSVLKEARLLFERDGISAVEAIGMITWRAADALDVRAGRLAEGAFADLVVMPVDAEGSVEEILGRILTADTPPAAVWVGGIRAV
jgi:cytosine/adenosine deaminase-related metal-dependent hydrolase